MSLLDVPLHHKGYELDKFKAYFEGWKLLQGLTPDLYPPVMEITADMFQPPRVGAILSAHADELKKRLERVRIKQGE
jgi:hypothetical protein